jgi:hypothetical protein
MMSAILLAALVDGAHGGHRWSTTWPALLGLRSGRRRQLVGLPGVLGALLDRRGQLFHRGGGLFQRAGLLFGRCARSALPWAISAAAEFRSLSHTKWDCKYHIVFIPKRRKKVIYGQIRRMLGEMFHELAAIKTWKLSKGICGRIMFICA